MPSIAAVDLFCGVGGLSLGLQQAGVDVRAGVDVDPACRFPYEQNLSAEFLSADVATIGAEDLAPHWVGDFRLLAGCAPCQPFSSHRRGADTSGEENWSLLTEFLRLVRECTPDFVTMENVPRLRNQPIFTQFIADLRTMGFAVDAGILHGPSYGLPQNRRRLVLLASRHGVIRIPPPNADSCLPTVRSAIGHLPPIANGETDGEDALHIARRLNATNLERLRASVPGGSWEDWPEDLRAPCHRKESGRSFRAFYGRMSWDEPAPTITTMPFNAGTGRFGHPEQDRTLTLREAAILQGFPDDYAFVAQGETPSMSSVGRLIGNAVPPAFGKAIGRQFLGAASKLQETA
ncbi:DNA cytosine methyltransferase [Aquipuribacter sp. MA13-6]|uniref:DNA cytosine methyltransferase n=1 Tax=unclassified Aquipuribacter TaxID=2635084 RepID=UPI003EE89134